MITKKQNVLLRRLYRLAEKLKKDVVAMRTGEKSKLTNIDLQHVDESLEILKEMLDKIEVEK